MGGREGKGRRVIPRQGKRSREKGIKRGRLKSKETEKSGAM